MEELSRRLPEHGEIISMRLDSVVVRTEEGVYKCYRPDKFSEWRERYEQNSPYSEMHGSEFIRHQRELFYNEWAVVKALSELKIPVIPRYRGADRDIFCIFFDYIREFPLYQDEAKAIWAREDIDDSAKQRELEKLTEEMVSLSLVPFHQACNAEMRKLVAYSRVRGGGKEHVRLKMRDVKERRKRLRSYFYSIFCERSEALEQYWEQKGINSDELSLGKLRRHLHYFGRSYRLDERLLEIVQRDSRITRLARNLKDSGFVAGDFRMQNVFRTGDPNNVLVFDFDKARRGSRNIDLYHCINNPHRFPFKPDKECASLEMAARYFRRTGFDKCALPQRLASYIGSGILEEARWWAINCQVHPGDLRQFFGERKKFDGMADEQVRSYIIHTMYPRHLLDLFNYYRYQEGEGWEEVLRKPLLYPDEGIDRATREERKELLEEIRQQFRAVEDILKETDCLCGRATSKQRMQRIRAISTS
jgi:hypothetical protein